MNPRHNRFPRVMKWSGLVSCILLVVAWAASVFWPFGYFGPNVAWVTGNGVILVNLPSNDSRLNFLERWLSFGPDDWLGFKRLGFKRPRIYGMKHFIIPYWCILLSIAIPTYLLWRRARTKPVGHCQQCGYNLTGNESGTCPECGTKVGQP